jgi:hypothetical protein
MQVCSQFQIILNGKGLKNLPSFRHLGNTQFNYTARGEAADRNTGKNNLAAFGRHNTGQRIEQRSLSRAVGSDKRNDFPFQQMQRNIFQRVHLAVVCIYVFYLQHSDLVKNSYAALCCIFRHCGVR